MNRQGALITISKQELCRYKVLQAVLKGELSLAEVVDALGVTYRHAKRLKARAKLGLEAMAHGNRGRSPSNMTNEQTRAALLELSQEKYSSFNDTRFREFFGYQVGDEPKLGDSACDKAGGGDPAEAKAEAKEASPAAREEVGGRPDGVVGREPT